MKPLLRSAMRCLTKKGVGFVCVTLATLSVTCTNSFAYDKDTHYLLTYYLARQVGYTPIQSAKIANADVGVDGDPMTEPLQGYSVSMEARAVHHNYHAFLNTTIEGKTEEETFALRESAKDSRMAALYQQGVKVANPGMYLHFLQDTFAHRDADGIPYEDIVGHGLEGHRPDYLSTNKERAKAMVQKTLAELERYKRDLLHEEPALYTSPGIDRVLNALIEANDPSLFATRDILNPSESKARDALNNVWRDTVPIPARVAYHFRSDGMPLDPQNIPMPIISGLPVLVIDRSGSLVEQPGAMQQIQSKASEVVQAIQDTVGEAAVINFAGAGSAILDADFTSDPATLQRAIQSPTPGNGGTAIYDAVVGAVSVATKKKRQSMLIIFTDGKNNQGQGLSQAIGYCKQNKVPVIVVGFVGTEGRDEAAMSQLADGTDGFYIANEDASMQTILKRFENYGRVKHEGAPIGGA